MIDELTAARYLCLGVPAMLMMLALLTDRRRTDRGAALLSFVAAFVGIAALHELAVAAGWYAFTPVAGAYRGLPVDAWLGWAALWGPVPVLLRRWLPLPVALGLLLWLDVVTMPRLDALVTLGPDWLVAEVVGLLAVALPAQLLGRWTADRSCLRARVLLQLAVFTGAVLWLLPSVAFTLGDGSWAAPTGHYLLLGQVALLLAVPGLAAVREFATRGDGTPYPWDPPRRLATTGPYAYLANPMQVSAVALLLLLAVVAGSVTLAAAACAAAAFAAGVAAPHEREDLARRYGPQWYAYRRQIRPWRPRLHPYRPDPYPPAGAEATLWLDAGCPACRATARLLRRRRARLRIAPAHRHVRILRRARYEDPAGGVESGVGAVARGLEHLGLGWAYLGWLLRLPGIRALAQVVTDALIAPPHPARDAGRPGAGQPGASHRGRAMPETKPDTKRRLLDGAITAVRRHGIAGASARNIAAAAGVNQALVFYHFGSVDDLLAAACTEATAGRVAHYAPRFAAVDSLRELLELGRAVHAQERELGNVSVLAQLLAGAQAGQRLAAPVAAALRLWTDQIEQVLHRLLAGSPLADLADVPGLARAVSAAFIGIELYEGVDAEGAGAALAALEQLGLLVEVVEDLGPVARRALRARLHRAAG